MDIKQPTTYDEQIHLLMQYGCMIQDENFCKARLKEIGYYRFSGYALPFKGENNLYLPGTTFERIFYLYQFDSNLRAIMFSCIEDIEIFLRSNFSYYFSHRYGALGYKDSSNYSAKHKHDVFTQKYEEEVNNNSNIPFVQHHIEKYGGEFPLWVLMELFTFGMLSFFYSDMKPQDKKFLAHDLYDTVPSKLSSWLYCCTELRNICSHYGRLYFRNFSGIPTVEAPESDKRKLWAYLLMIKSLYPDTSKWNQVVLPRIFRIFELYSEYIDLSHIAFPENWKEQLHK